MTEGLSPREKRSIDELYKILAQYRREIDRIARAQDTRLTTLGPNDAINFVDGEGKPVARIGGSGAYGYSSDLVQYLDGPIPDAPGEPLIEGGAGVIRVTLGDGAEPSDARLCRVHASLDADFEPSYATVVGSLIPGTSTVAISVPAGTWYCCVQWLTLSGKESEVSPVVSVEVDAMVDMSDLDEARAEADQKWADFAVREQEFQDAIDAAQSQIDTVQGILDQLPEPADFDTAVQQIQDAITALGDVSQRLQDAEAALDEKASTAALNDLSGHMAQLGNDLSAAESRIEDAESSLSEVGSDLAGLGDRLGVAEQEITSKAAASELSDLDDRLSAIVIPDVSALATRAELTDFAQDAQAEYDRLQELAERALSRAGDNQLEDPSFETNYWFSRHSRASVYTGDARTGTQSAEYTAGTSVHSTFATVDVEPNQSWRFAIWYRTLGSPNLSNGNGTALRLRNGANNAVLATSEVFQPVGDEWTRAVVTYTVPDGVSQLSAALYYTHTQGRLFVDDVAYQEVGAAAEALRLAEVARQQAEAAHLAAGKARDNADAAAQIAGSKSSITWSTSAPSGTAAIGDVHQQRGPSGITATWEYTTSGWQSRKVTSELIDNVTVGQLVAGDVLTPSAVINKLWVDGIVGFSADLARAVISAPSIIDDLDFGTLNDGNLRTWTAVPAADWTTLRFNWSDRTMTRISNAASSAGVGSGIYWGGTTTANASIPCVVGEEFRVRFQVVRYAGASNSDDYRVQFRWADVNGAAVGWTTHYWQEVSHQGWGEASATAPAGAVRFYLRFYTPGSNAAARGLGNVTLKRMTDGTLIVENSVSTRHLNVTGEMAAALVNADKGAFINLIAQDLIADNAEIISAAMKNLTVTERAQFAAAFAQEIWAELGVFDRLEATSGWIGGTMLQDGGVEARHVTATESLVTKILGFETAVADNLVLNQELWARSATIINAVMQTLSVTEKANFVDAFAETFWTNDLAARTATLGRTIVSAPSLITDPDFQDVSTTAGEGGWWNGGGWQPVTVAWSDRATFMRLSPDATGSGTHSITYGGTNSSNASIPCQAGEEYSLRFQVLRYVGWQASDDFQVRFAWVGKGSTLSYTDFSWSSVGHQAWMEVEATAPEGATHFYLWFRKTGTVGSSRGFGDVTLKRKFGGELLVDGTVQARKLQADEIWANSTWQNEAYFGSSDATYQTRVNGQGLEVLRTDDTGDRVPAVALGSGELGLTFWDEEGEPTGSITHDGYVSGDLVSAQRNVIIAGQPLVGALEEIPDGLAILDAYPKGEIARGEQNMQNLSVSGTTTWLFMECDAAQVYQGRSYRIEVEPFSITEDTNMFLDFNYTLNGSHPHGGTSNAGTLRSANRTFQGSLRFTPPTDGLLRIGPKIRRASSGTISFPSSFANVKMTIYDEGLATPGGGMRRNATSSNPDPQGLQREYHSAWTPTWYQTYRDGSRYTWPRPLRGRDGAGRLFSSQVGGYRSALSTAGLNGEQGVTIGNALNGADLLGGSISIQAQSTPASSGGWFRIYWHTNTSSPNSFSPTTTPPNYIDYLVLSGGQTGRLALPQACLDAIKDGTFGGFSFHPGGSTQGYMGITGLDGRTTAQPILRLRYRR